MTLAEALAAIKAGNRVRSNSISNGWVVKLVQEGSGWPIAKVVNEATGSSYAFDEAKPDHVAADWQLVTGWAL